MPNYLDRYGAYSAAAVGQRSVLPTATWWALVVLACVSMPLLFGFIAEFGVRVDRTSLIFGLSLIVGTVGQAAIGQGNYGRYLLPLIPIAALPFLKAGTQARWKMALPSLLGLFMTGLTLTANGLAFDAARWSAASALQRDGVPAVDIDAGLEWVGYHAAGPARPNESRPKAAGWFLGLFPESRECYVVAASPLPQAHLVSTYKYSTYAVAGHAELYVYRDVPCR
jgi:hypothetical protein